MNLSHLRATLWLRWRILRNRVRRAGKLNNVLFGILLFIGACVSVGAFALALILGLETLPGAEPVEVMVAWGALAMGFIFFWAIGLLTDLQRSDAMSFKNLLHLPVSLGWVFLYNYLSSFVSVSVAIFLPAMVGLSLAMIFVHGPLMLLSFPLLLGFFVMITGLTYQLRGWLARLMEDKRRGRNIVAAITVGFVLLLQLPNLINIGINRGSREERQELRDERSELRTRANFEGPEQAAAQSELARIDAEGIEGDHAIERKITLGTMLIPVGWLPYGMRATSEGQWVRGGLCALGLLSIGAWSLRRSYRATLLSVVGGGGGSVASAAEPSSKPVGEGKTTGERGTPPKTPMIERSLPFATESVAVIALAGLRGLLRAPELKLLLLGPVILLGLFGVMLSNESTQESLRSYAPSLSLGAIAIGLLSIIQLLQNQFGLDRGGFRAYLLSPVPRERVLLGKNLATAPLGIGIGLVALIGLQVLMPADLAHFIGNCMQLLSANMLMCMIGNLTSILAPMRLRENGLKAANAKFMTAFLQFVSMILIPIVLSPLAIPFVVEFFLGWQDWARHVPVYLLLHTVGLIGVFFVYRWVIRRQGGLLQEREQRMLDVLTRD